MADLIDVAELDTGRRELRMEPVRPIDILRDAALRFQEEARKRDVQIQIEAFSDLSPIYGDRRALKSVMDNLLSNALRFTRRRARLCCRRRSRRSGCSFSCGIQASGLSRSG